MPKSINLTGTNKKEYNLDELSSAGTRSSADEALKVQIWKWPPNLPASDSHSKPNPPNLQLGQIWMSRLMTDEELAEYKQSLK